MFRFRLERLSTHIDEVLLVTDEQQRVRALDFGDYHERMLRLLRLHYGASVVTLVEHTDLASPPSQARRALEAYFAGDLSALDALEVQTGGTSFQRLVWSELRKIPVGHTINYGQLAERIGRPTAVRAVGHANGANAVGIIIPCHRVIGTNASLTGYAGGVHRKHWLLTHEGVPNVRAPREREERPAVPKNAAQGSTVEV